MNESIRPLLDDCLIGNEKAWRTFISQFHRLISGTVARYVHGSEIKDCVQLVYLRITQKEFELIRRFQGDSFPAFLIYLSEIAKNVSLSQTRIIQRMEYREGIGLEDAIDFLDERETAETRYLQAEEKNEFYDQITLLDEPSREILLLRLSGYKFREISQILSQPLGTVLARAKRAREKLKKIVIKEIKS